MIYRLATPADAEGIARLIHATWGTQVAADWVAEIVDDPRHNIWVADDAQEVVGFCDSFPTAAADGTPRWEIDLLAVDSQARGQGVGRALIGRAVQSGRQRVTALQRALVAIDNIASERCFEANGFRAETRCDLWVGPPASTLAPAPVPAGAHLIPVETLTYQGIWVERRFDSAALTSARQRALRDGRNTVGAVIPHGLTHDAGAHGFAHIASYQWWIREE